MFILLKLDIFIITYDHGQWSRTGAYVHLKDLRDSPLETLLIMELNVICFWIPCQYNHWGVLSPCEPVLSCVQFFASPWTYPVRCLWPWDYPARILLEYWNWLPFFSSISLLRAFWPRDQICVSCVSSLAGGLFTTDHLGSPCLKKSLVSSNAKEHIEIGKLTFPFLYSSLWLGNILI